VEKSRISVIQKVAEANKQFKRKLNDIEIIKNKTKGKILLHSKNCKEEENNIRNIVIMDNLIKHSKKRLAKKEQNQYLR